MCSKPFFSHEEKRENIEFFMHSQVGYDKGRFNDFALRENLFNHWKSIFYEPVKEKRLYKNKLRNYDL